MVATPHVRYEFGPFRVDPDRRLLLHNHQPVALTPKVFAVLLALVRHSQEVVPKDELLQDVWPGRVVEESNLSQCIFMLRKRLAEVGADPHCIITLPGTGYQFTTPVRACVEADHAAPASGAIQGPDQDVGGTREKPASLAGSVDAPCTFRPEGPDTGFLATDRLLAVLPFRSGDESVEQQSLAEDLTRSLRMALTPSTGLKATPHDSAAPHHRASDAAASAGILVGATHVLTGTVWRVERHLQIDVTLVDVADGSRVWSKRYDDTLDQWLALHGVIAAAVADALRAQPRVAAGVSTPTDRPSNGHPEAWVAYQQGNVYAALGTARSAQLAIAAYQRAIILDANYAAAYAGLCNVWIDQWSAAGIATTGSIGKSLAEARAAISNALRLNPSSSMARRAHARLLLTDMDWEGARAEAAVALRLTPNDATARFEFAVTMATLGRVGQAANLLREAILHDPSHAAWYKWLSMFLAALGQLDAARVAAVTAISLQPEATDFHAQLVLVEVLRGDPVGALDAARQETAGVWSRIATALARQIGPDHAAANAALDDLVAKHATDAAYQIAEIHALRGDADSTFGWLERAWTARDGGIASLLLDPLLLRYREDPRFAAFCTRVGLPVTTDAIAAIH